KVGRSTGRDFDAVAASQEAPWGRTDLERGRAPGSRNSNVEPCHAIEACSANRLPCPGDPGRPLRVVMFCASKRRARRDLLPGGSCRSLLQALPPGRPRGLHPRCLSDSHRALYEILGSSLWHRLLSLPRVRGAAGIAHRIPPPEPPFHIPPILEAKPLDLHS